MKSNVSDQEKLNIMQYTKIDLCWYENPRVEEEMQQKCILTLNVDNLQICKTEKLQGC